MVLMAEMEERGHIRIQNPHDFPWTCELQDHKGGRWLPQAFQAGAVIIMSFNKAHGLQMAAVAVTLSLTLISFLVRGLRLLSNMLDHRETAHS